MRFKLWHWMTLVAVSGLIAAGYAWLTPPEAKGSSSTIVIRHDFFIVCYGHVFPATSPAFWVILVLGMALNIALLAGFIAMSVMAWKAVRRRARRTL